MAIIVRRIIFTLLIIVALAPGLWLYDPVPQPNWEAKLRIVAQPLPSQARLVPHLGPFKLEGIWWLESPNKLFSGYSALLALGDGELLAIADRNTTMRFTAPGYSPRPVEFGFVRPWQLVERNGYDSESATFDPVTKRIWVGWEGSNSITRQSLEIERRQRNVGPAPDFGPWWVARPRVMADWGRNNGPEAIARLFDGRFIVLREGAHDWFGRRRHKALLFAGDPIDGKPPHAFTLEGPAGFSVTDMAQLPDGRVLILMRKLLWPAPARFTGRIVIADPAEIRAGGVWHGSVVAKLSSSLPVDNFEGMAIEPRADGKLTVWLISDDNSAVTQRTLLWKLAVDPARL